MERCEYNRLKTNYEDRVLSEWYMMNLNIYPSGGGMLEIHKDNKKIYETGSYCKAMRDLFLREFNQ